MGIGSRRPPLPAPTDISVVSSVDHNSVQADDLATDLSRRTDQTSFSLPEDGRPVTISTQKAKDLTGASQGSRAARQVPTSLLIEYFEGGVPTDKPHPRSSVRVRVTPSAKSGKGKGKEVSDHIRITEAGRDRKPTYTKRISLSKKGKEAVSNQGSDVSGSNDQERDFRPPVEVEVLQSESEVSQPDAFHARYLPAPSNISSMPPDSMLEGRPTIKSPATDRSRSVERKGMFVDENTLKTPLRRRSRSLSRERITQKVMEKLASNPKETISHTKGSKTKSSTMKKESNMNVDERRSSARRRSSKSEREEESISGGEPSLLSPSRRSDQHSVRSGVSAASSINNPKLLQTVEDAIRRLILPEINALKEGQRSEMTKQRPGRSTHEPLASGSTTPGEEGRRRVSKSSSAPNVAVIKPRVVVDRDGEEEILVSGGSRRESTAHRANRESEKLYDRRESGGSSSKGEKARRKKDKDRHRAKESAAVAASAGSLTAAALRRHDSRDNVEVKEKRRRPSKSGSRTTSMAESIDDNYRKKEIPPLPMQSEVQSELTRASIRSAETETGRSFSNKSNTPLREIPPTSGLGPSSPRDTPTRSKVYPTHSEGYMGAHSDHRVREVEYRDGDDYDYEGAIKDADSAIHRLKYTGAKAGEGQAALQSRSGNSPAINEGNYRDEAHVHGRHQTHVPSRNADTPPISSRQGSLRRSKVRPQGVNLETRQEVVETGASHASHFTEDDILYSNDEAHVADEEDREYEEDRQTPKSYLRDSLDVTNKHLSQYTDDSADAVYHDKISSKKDLRGVGANPHYVHTPLAVESAVASLYEPSSLSVKSSESGQLEERYFATASTSGRYNPTAEAEFHPDESYLRTSRNGFTATQTYGAQQTDSPRQSYAPSETSESLHMGANAIPHPDHQMPEIGHGLDDESDINTNPSAIQGPINGDDDFEQRLSPHYDHGLAHTAGGLSMQNAAVAAEIADLAALNADGHDEYDDDLDVQSQNRSVDLSGTKDYDASGQAERTPKQSVYNNANAIPRSPAHMKDEGYISAAKTVPSPNAYTPELSSRPGNRFGEEEAQATADMNDPFLSAKQLRHLSGNSHGMSSPLYDSATGRGIDRIHSNDIIALMDHLTVRDAQRNARDTEMLVTLVRSAADMRNSFEDIKKFIEAQDKMVMGHTEKMVDTGLNRTVQGPRKQPALSPRTPRRSSEETEDGQARRKNVFRRALQGLSLKSSNDLAKIEEMLMQLLTDVESLKEVQGIERSPAMQGGSLSSLEHLQNPQDSGYEPEGQAGTSSTPNQSEHFSAGEGSMRHGNGLRSGYESRVLSDNRISTVFEGDEELGEEDLEILGDMEPPHRLLTPTQEARRVQSSNRSAELLAHEATKAPMGAESTSRSLDPKGKRRSNTSSLWGGIPKISRWSKTTASTVADNFRSSGRRERPLSEASRSGSHVNEYEDDYELQKDDQLPSGDIDYDEDVDVSAGAVSGGPAPAMAATTMKHTQLELDDPKYQAHRNSLNLQHPQPRAGATQRHQSHLESQADHYQNYDSPDLEQAQWGSMPSLAKHAAAAAAVGGGGNAGYRAVSLHGPGELSPISSEDDADDDEEEYIYDYEGGYNQGPARPPKIALNEVDDLLLQPPNQNYATPYGSGTQLAPIEEVRRSLESDRGDENFLRASPKRGAMQTPQRKITGPRPMGSRSPNSSSQAKGGETREAGREVGGGSGHHQQWENERSGTVRRKPIGRSVQVNGCHADTFDEETF